MADKTGIPYCTTTLNPVVGCEPVSPGCAHCYAARLASTRLSKMPGYAGTALDGVFVGKLVYRWRELDKIDRWREPRVVFLGNMGDVFHPAVPTDFHECLWRKILTKRKHRFLFLTKRPEEMARKLRYVFASLCGDYWMRRHVVPDHIWLGVSVENQETWRNRVPALVDIPSYNHWVSMEPLLEYVTEMPELHHGSLTHSPLRRVNWVVVGGESGPKARRFDLDWARHVRDVCEATGTSFFFKQTGANCVSSSQTGPCRDFPTRGAGADPDAWPEDLQVRQLPFEME